MGSYICGGLVDGPESIDHRTGGAGGAAPATAMGPTSRDIGVRIAEIATTIETASILPFFICSPLGSAVMQRRRAVPAPDCVAPCRYQAAPLQTELRTFGQRRRADDCHACLAQRRQRQGAGCHRQCSDTRDSGDRHGIKHRAAVTPVGRRQQRRVAGLCLRMRHNMVAEVIAALGSDAAAAPRARIKGSLPESRSERRDRRLISPSHGLHPPHP
jgi:hypothetical protein